jgi:hypothetical protein
VIHASNKNKKEFYYKLAKVLSLKNVTAIGPKLRNNRSVVIVDDLSLPLPTLTQENALETTKATQIASFISTMINEKVLYTP